MIIHEGIDQNTDEWHALRVGKPTASEFHKIVTSTGARSKQLEEYATQIAAEAWAGKPLERWQGNSATERGHELEDEARRTYCFVRSVEPRRVSFVENDSAGASPDSLIDDRGVLEIKCQLAKGHLQTLAYHAKHDKCPPEYYAQAQGQLYICEREWVDLMFYHPSMPELVIRIGRNEEFMAALIVRIAETVAERDRLIEIIRRYA